MKLKSIAGLVILSVLFLWFWLSLPATLFEKPVSIVLESNKNELMGAHIAADEQWRFPANDTVPEKFRKAIVCYEDEKFYFHHGIDFTALARAFYLNLKHQKIISGGSTLTMQVIRLSREQKKRSIFEKIIEIILAVRLEMTFSKKEILALYASNAPYGGNVVGLDAAAWRYFGRKAGDLTWSEAALLAVLPNSPALIHPGKNRELLFKKRNFLLLKLFNKGYIDADTYELSISEPLPEQPKAFPDYAPHLLTRAFLEQKGGNRNIVHSTLDFSLQKKVLEIIDRYNKVYSGNGIFNACALVIENETGNVLAYVGNTRLDKAINHGQKVDVINAPRSTGSILKPFLYASMLTSGELLPDALIPDIPIQINGYSPQNFSLSYDGAIPASRALARSLNVPAVKLLQEYGVERFIYVLRKSGLTTVNMPADHYGLSLILGGCEGKLWEITGVYSSMARILNHYSLYDSRYNRNDIFMPHYENTNKTSRPDIAGSSVFSASAVWFTFNAMLEVERPENETNWAMFDSKEKIAWKTGTSFGFRDGWAVGVTPDYTVGVWVGNADGEGRPELTGIKTAAPVLFEIFNLLPVSGHWFYPPYDDMVQAPVCSQSGFFASDICPDVDSVWIPQASINYKKCPYHRMVHLDKNGHRVHDGCEQTWNMQHTAWFILPPAMEWYYKQKKSTYKTLPPYRDDCLENLQEKTSIKMMEVIYPKNLAQIFVPIELTGNLGRCIFEVAHRKNNAVIYWHIDDKYLGQTQSVHKFQIFASPGIHKLTLIDSEGNECNQQFSILNKN